MEFEMPSADATRGDTLVKHLFRYLALPSQSDARAKVVPSTEGQWAMNPLEHMQAVSDEILASGANETLRKDLQSVLRAGRDQT